MARQTFSLRGVVLGEAEPPPQFDPGPEWEGRYLADLGIVSYRHTNGATAQIAASGLDKMMTHSDVRAAVLAGMADGAEKFPGKPFRVLIDRTWKTNEMPVLRGYAEPPIVDSFDLPGEEG